MIEEVYQCILLSLLHLSGLNCKRTSLFLDGYTNHEVWHMLIKYWQEPQDSDSWNVKLLPRNMAQWSTQHENLSLIPITYGKIHGAMWTSVSLKLAGQSVWLSGWGPGSVRLTELVAKIPLLETPPPHLQWLEKSSCNWAGSFLFSG